MEYHIQENTERYSEGVMKKKHIIISVGCFLLIIIGGPIIINELYKSNKGYVTVWNGSDMLSYFGAILGTVATILGAIATIWVLNRTITFSLKQLRYERYIQKQGNKWANIENLFVCALIHAQPLTLNSIYLSSISNQSTMIGCAELQKYIYDAKGAFDNIVGTIEDSDLPKVEKLLDALRKINDINSQQANSFLDLLMSYHMISNNSDESARTIGSLALLEKQKAISAKIDKIHSNDYLALLNLKKECFKEIYQNIDDEAKRILDQDKSGGRR